MFERRPIMNRKLAVLLVLLAGCGSSAGRAPEVVDADGGSADAGVADAGQLDAGPLPIVCPAPDAAVEDAWIADPSLCLVRWASNVTGARGMAFAPNGDLFVVSRTRGLVVLWDADGDGVSGAG